MVGKVDLDSLSPKKRARKPLPGSKKPGHQAQTTLPRAKSSHPSACLLQRPRKKQPPPSPTEVVRAKAEKLSGPTVVGKIELPVEKKPTTAGEKAEAKAHHQGGCRGRWKTGWKTGTHRHRRTQKEISDKDIQKEIKETLARLSKGKKTQASAKTRRAKRDAKPERAESASNWPKWRRHTPSSSPSL